MIRMHGENIYYLRRYARNSSAKEFVKEQVISCSFIFATTVKAASSVSSFREGRLQLNIENGRKFAKVA